MKFPASNWAPLKGTCRRAPRVSGKLARKSAVLLLVCSPLVLASGCKRLQVARKPALVLEQVPAALGGGSDPLGRIAGKVTNGEPGAHIVLYARNGSWYVQPFRSHSQTEVAKDGTWNNVTHFGSEYAALLVRSDYRPPATLATLPSVDGSVLAVATAKGTERHSVDPEILHFSGYDWKVRSSLAARGSDVSDYAASNAWVDGKGYLHLRMGQEKGQWYCASVTMTRSLGYGTYRFVIADSAHLPVSPVLSIFAHPDLEDAVNKTGLRIELSQWGKPHVVNADYVVSPYYVPGNSAHFTVPPGPMTHVLRWEPGTAEFTTLKGASAASHDVVMDHVFKSGIPIPLRKRFAWTFMITVIPKAVFKIPLRLWSRKLNICHRRGWLRHALASLIVLLILGGGTSTFALSGERSLNQYVHTSWGADKGLIGGSVAAIARSSDGYLWLGTELGLVRFDGYEFILIDTAPLPGHEPLGPVRGLTEDGDGNLWIRLNGQRVLEYRNGVFENATDKFELFDVAFTAMTKDAQDHLLLWGPGSKTKGFRNGKFKRVFPQDAINGIVTSMVETSPGVLWLGTRDAGLYRFADGHYSKLWSEFDLLSVNALAPSEDGGVWVGLEKGLYLWEDGRRVPLELPEELNKAQISALVRDRNHNLWVGTDAGLYRIDPKLKKVTGVFRSSDDPQISAVYEDDEGNIWFANTHGLERLRDGMFTSIAGKELSLKELGGSIFVDDKGGTWFGPVSGGLFHLVNGVAQRIEIPGLDRDVVYSITGSRDEIWLGRRHGGLTQLKRRGGDWVPQTFTRADGLAQDSVYTATRAQDGSVWAGTVSGGISVLRNGRFQTYNVDNGLRSDAIFASLEAADHTMWFASSSGLVHFDGAHWINYEETDTGAIPNVRTLFEDSSGVLWIGTAHGLARLENNRIEILRDLPQVLNEEVLSIGQDGQGFLWVITSNHVLQIDRPKLLSGTLRSTDVLSYSLDDGLTETQSARRDRSLVSDSSGRIWLSLAHSIAVADVKAAQNYRRPVRVRIDGISLEGDTDVRGDDLNLPSGIRSITFRYSGMNLAMPRRTQFRYMLGGLDKTWSSDASLRQVVYSHLSPGSYTFRIMGTDALGAWNGPETDVVFTIRPAFWQTWYFQAASGIVLAILGIGLYRIRMMQVTAHLNQRFQDRLAERTRIAQDLHDTLLQGVISASMQLDVAQDHLSEKSSARPLLQRVLQLMRQVTEEGREALHGLRTIDSSISLETAFKRMTAELIPFETSGSFLYVQGDPNPLKPAVFDEIYRIGREAYTNAVAHAAASRIEITIEYGVRNFRLRVTDDGCGIDSTTLKHGRDGHWGLAGMRERAAAIGCSLSIRTRTPGGTDVELRVPASIAYSSPRSLRKHWPWQMRRRYAKSQKDTRR